MAADSDVTARHVVADIALGACCASYSANFACISGGANFPTTHVACRPPIQTSYWKRLDFFMRPRIFTSSVKDGDGQEMWIHRS